MHHSKIEGKETCFASTVDGSQRDSSGVTECPSTWRQTNELNILRWRQEEAEAMSEESRGDREKANPCEAVWVKQKKKKLKKRTKPNWRPGSNVFIIITLSGDWDPLLILNWSADERNYWILMALAIVVRIKKKAQSMMALLFLEQFRFFWNKPFK